MFKQEDNTMETSLREQALNTQQSVGAITKLVDEVHRRTMAAKICQVALTTEVDKLKKKKQEYKAVKKAQIKRKFNKDTTHGPVDKSSQEDMITTVETDEPLTLSKPITEANVTEAELEAALDDWLKKVIDARDESAVVTKDAQREKMVDQKRDEAVKARQEYEKIKKAYEREAYEKPPDFYVSSTSYSSSGPYGWTSPYHKSGVNSLTRVRSRELRPTPLDSKDEGFLEKLEFETTSDEKRLRIRDMKRVMMPLVPGQEIAWATMMEQVVNRGIPGEEALALQALMPQLTAHSEVAAQATNILVQAAGKTYEEKDVLSVFFSWIKKKYQFSPRKKREIFAKKLREMRWNWRSNPADKIANILAQVQLTWEELENQPALREELEAALGSNLNVSLQLEITQRPPEEWKQAITEIWESVKHNIRPE